MKAALAVVALAAAAVSCEPSGSPSKGTILRESYLIARVLGDDSTAFSAYEALATADTGSWLWTRVEWRGMRASFSATLGHLGYGTGPFTWKYGARERHALSTFQHDLGIRETGTLDSLTIVHLVRADSSLTRPSVSLSLFGFYTEPGYVSAHGTWKALTNSMGYPVNSVDIECNAQTGLCEEARIEFIDRQLSHVGRIHRSRYQIKHWSGTSIVADGEDWPGSDCHATLTITIPTKEVITHQWCTGDSTLDMFSHGPEEMTLKLVDGARLAPPLDGGDLKELHQALYRDKERYLALLKKNTLVDDLKP